jgi:saccharopine dehydrogenase-like NADP-dependent oxidoreductase
LKHIVIFGAGKSSTFLIEYIIAQLPANNWQLTVLDIDQQAAQAKIGNAPLARALPLNVENEPERKSHVSSSDIVISLLPPALHYKIALDCIEFKKNLLTASYIDPAIEKLRADIDRQGLLFLCEMGLDPGIDHMSAMKIIHGLEEKKATIISFRSHCGGLVAPESDDNPWHYKISWNPRNVILAGKAGAIYKENGKEIQLLYEQLFNIKTVVNIEGIGPLSYYPNRDSLSYIDLYGLHSAKDFIRTTLRYPAFCKGWQKIIEFKLTDEYVQYETNNKTIKQFFSEHFIKYGIDKKKYEEVTEQLHFIGLEDDVTMINKGKCSAADVMQFILEKKLVLRPQDKDMIVVLHEIDYVLNGKVNTLKSSLVVKGQDNIHTAMAKTVGLPLGIAAKMILQENIKVKGLHIPIISEIYEPVLKELEMLGVQFNES